VRTDDFNFDLPEASIAQYPANERGTSRLFVLDRESGGHIDSKVSEICGFLEPGTVIVFNDSKVRKARLYGTADDTGAKVEFLLLSPVIGRGDPVNGSSAWFAMCSKAKRQKTGRTYLFPGGLKGRIASEREDEKIVEFDAPVGDSYLDANGHMPLPPYIKRSDEQSDAERYQTVYARTTGSAACPTAGLHFTRGILDSITSAGIDVEWVTLHVGLGTFLPVRVENIEQHTMHEEWYSVPEKTAEAVNAAKRDGRKVLAVGTTSLRTLESAWSSGNGPVSAPSGLRAGNSSTSIFIYPGYRFNVVDSLFTNFHTPKSTLLMLVAAFAGKEKILESYREAVKLGYKFYSYGDAMLIR